jgi:alginate export protein
MTGFSRCCGVALIVLLLIGTASTLAAQGAAAQGPPTTAPNAPTAFANLDLPAWLRLGVEHRGRLEGFTGSGFAVDREDLYWLNRFRVTARISPKPWFTAAIQAQDARVEGRNGAAAGAPFRDQLDLRLAHADVGAFEKSRVAVRAGRQELVFGDQRLVGHGNWLNTARSFDGARVVFRQTKFRIDGFAASVVALQVDKFNESGGGNYLSGGDAQLIVLPQGGIVEPYEFVRNSRNLRTEAGDAGDLTSFTTGVRLNGKVSSKTDYNAEVAVQRGTLGSDTISAWAGHWLVGRMIPVGTKSVRAFGEYNYASGDETPGDGARGTFDQLYPTAHDKYGLADQVGWKNIHHVRAGLEFRPQSKLLLSGGYHSYWLATSRDALYSASGAVLARIAAGASDRHVGQEVDLQATYTHSARVHITGGYAHLFTGAFLKAATPGQAYNFPYVMVTTMLLGMEK